MLLFIVFNVTITKAQTENVEYYYIDNITTETYKEWSNTLDLNVKSALIYTCFPAKIIGIKGEYAQQFLKMYQKSFKSIKRLDISSKEAEGKCASNRKFK